MGQFVAEDARAHLVGEALTADDGGIEIDFDVKVEAGVVRSQFAPAIAFADRRRI